MDITIREFDLADLFALDLTPAELRESERYFAHADPEDYCYWTATLDGDVIAVGGIHRQFYCYGEGAAHFTDATLRRPGVMGRLIREVRRRLEDTALEVGVTRVVARVLRVASRARRFVERMDFKLASCHSTFINGDEYLLFDRRLV